MLTFNDLTMRSPECENENNNTTTCSAKYSINDLPDEVIEFVLSFVPPYKDLHDCMLVCKRWRINVLSKFFSLGIFFSVFYLSCIIFDILFMVYFRCSSYKTKATTYIPFQFQYTMANRSTNRQNTNNHKTIFPLSGNTREFNVCIRRMYKFPDNIQRFMAVGFVHERVDKAARVGCVPNTEGL